MSLRDKTTHAIAWQFAARLTERGLRFASSIVLARLLAPEDFGALAAVLVVASAVEALTYLGIDQAIAQSSRSADPRFLGAAFRLMAIRGALLAVTVFLSAPIVSWYFERADLAPLVRVIALSSLFTGLTNPWIQSERKELRLQPLSITLVVAGVAQVVVAVGYAWWGLGAMALAVANVASTFAATAAGWALVPRAVVLTRDKESTLELRRYAARAAGVPLLIAGFLQLPALVLGRAAGLPALGIFTLAQRLTSLPGEIALPVFGSVLAPAYAQIREDSPRLRRVWLRALGVVALLVTPAIAAMVALDDSVPRLVFGAQYAGAPGVVSMLALASFFSVLTSCCGPMFWGIARPDLDRIAMATRLVVLLVVGPFAARAWGAAGFAGAFAAAHAVCLVVCLTFARRVTDASWREITGALGPSIKVGTVCLAIALLVVRVFGSNMPAIAAPLIVLVLAAAGMVVLALRVKRALRGERNAGGTND